MPEGGQRGWTISEFIHCSTQTQMGVMEISWLSSCSLSSQGTMPGIDLFLLLCTEGNGEKSSAECSHIFILWEKEQKAPWRLAHYHSHRSIKAPCLDLHWVHVLIRMRFAFCRLWWGGSAGSDTHTHTPHLFCFRHWDTVHTYLKLKQRSQVCGIHIIIVIVTGLWIVSA